MGFDLPSISATIHAHTLSPWWKTTFFFPPLFPFSFHWPGKRNKGRQWRALLMLRYLFETDDLEQWLPGIQESSRYWSVQGSICEVQYYFYFNVFLYHSTEHFLDFRCHVISLRQKRNNTMNWNFQKTHFCQFAWPSFDRVFPNTISSLSDWMHSHTIMSGLEYLEI